MFTVLDTNLCSERIDLLVRVMCMKETTSHYLYPVAKWQNSHSFQPVTM